MAAVIKYVDENNIINKAVRITVFDKGYNISSRDIPYTGDIYERGYKLNISPIKRGNSILYRHKTTNYFESIYTKRNASKNKFDDGIFLNIDGTVLECSMSNIYFIKGDTVYTPSSRLPILNGTMKEKVFGACHQLDINIVEEKISIEEIDNYDFVFISNSLMKIMKITEIDGTHYDRSNEIFERLDNYFNSIDF